MLRVMKEMREKLLAIQVRERLTDGRMAVRLGITRQSWHSIKSGRVPLTERVALRAVGQWPELAMDLLNAAAATAA